MAQLQDDGYLSDAGRTSAEMQTAIETIRDILAELGSAAGELLTVSSDGIGAPASRLVFVRSEGHGSAASDVLKTIGVTNIDEGRFVVLRNNNTATTQTTEDYVTVEHSELTTEGKIHLTDDDDFVLSGERFLMLVLVGDQWNEVWRSYGRKNADDIVADRAFLGLGSSAVETMATGTGSGANGKVLKVAAIDTMAEDDILALDSSGNIVAGTPTGGDADTVDLKHAIDFVSATDTSVQTMANSLTLTGQPTAVVSINSTSSTGEPGVAFTESGTKRADIVLDIDDDNLEFRTISSGGAYKTGLRVNETNGRVEMNEDIATSSWASLTPGAGNGLDADTVDGNHASAMLNVLNVIATESAGAGTGGSFRVTDGTTTLLIQWPGTWVDGGLEGTSDVWTFPTAYTSTPVCIGGVVVKSKNVSTGVLQDVTASIYVRSTTALAYTPQSQAGSIQTNRYRVGVPIVIGEPSS